MPETHETDTLIEAAWDILFFLAILDYDADDTWSPKNRLLIRTVATLIAEAAATKDVGERPAFAAKLLDTITDQANIAERFRKNGANVINAIEGNLPNIKLRLQTAVDALVGVPI